jgi:hypothetical protein
VSVPFPDPVMVALLARTTDVVDVAGGRVSTVLDSVLPALRVTKVSDYERATAEEASPIYQVEVWADDELVAGDLAWRLFNAWPSAHAEHLLGALVHGRFSDSSPFSSPDPETESPRYLVALGIRLSGASE